MAMATATATSMFLPLLGCLFVFFHGFAGASHLFYEELNTVEPTSVSEQYRTAYHFQPPKNWMNDPNGPMYYNGLYHLFYQYNPYGAVWGNIVWAHSVSTDLVNWQPLEHAIYPTAPFDIKGCWSGSATILPNNKPIILYTGIDTQGRQVQNLAMPKNLSDPLLREWVKPAQHNPTMVPNGLNASSFRDPTTAWLGKDGHWRVLVGNKRHKRGMALLYRSRDFVWWVKAKHPLHSSKDTGMWECPDFFPVLKKGQLGIDTSVNGPHVKHVLKVSLDDLKHEYYTVGTYFPNKDRYMPDNTSADDGTGLRYDYGKFYASKTFFDGLQNRRILWGWMNESDSVNDDVAKGWSGVQAIPRTLWLDKSGKQLVQWPVVEIESLRGKKVDIVDKVLASGSVVEVPNVTAAQVDVEVTFELPSLDQADRLDSASLTYPQLLCSKLGHSNTKQEGGGIGPFGLLVLASKDYEERTAVFFRIFKKAENQHVVLMCSDQSRSSLQEDVDKTTYGGLVDVDLAHGSKPTLSLRTLVDRSIVESFGEGGKTCITSRVYPVKAVGENAHLYAFNYASAPITISKLSAWAMSKAKIN
ncbi:hypothetical protein AMTRI_Chr05g70040 [Amborella trichopoda]|uniref:beta-fructofuranosidase, insoluble isoenzyme CWINV1 isoform X2 n=1 Tax=Amborella trichopoda TaxID=13333 RepID=UPI0005D3C0EB|nr:beta-fructofuranosidase, insoluble isoenzyme CWINV1 isoform X2 [Amborella trichopoda]|eukprot:XP_011628522.1 beta-fructofuranosidase, insoluble isoenzyme CWINV1 isoform X2 [Amborella trichopoda]